MIRKLKFLLTISLLVFSLFSCDRNIDNTSIDNDNLSNVPFNDNLDSFNEETMLAEEIGYEFYVEEIKYKFCDLYISKTDQCINKHVDYFINQNYLKKWIELDEKQYIYGIDKANGLYRYSPWNESETNRFKIFSLIDSNNFAIETTTNMMIFKELLL